MIPYLILTLVPLLFIFIKFDWVKNKQVSEGNILVESHTTKVNNTLIIPGFFVIFFLILSLRDLSVGVDVINYSNSFRSISFKELESVLARDSDWLYYLLNWVVSRFTHDFRVFLAICAAITLIPIAYLYNEEHEWDYLKVVSFLVMPTFMLVFSGLRQAIAFSIAIIAYKYVREKKLIPFLIFALIAFGFHHSAFIVFSFYPLYYFVFKTKHLWFIVPGISLVFIFNRPIFQRLTAIASRLFGDDYSADISQTEGYTMLILFVLLAIFAYVIPDERKMDREALGLRNFLLMALLLQCFAPIHALAMRLNYYFILYIPIILPKIIKYRKDTFKEIGYLAGWVLTLFFLGYYLIKMYNSCQTGTGSLGIYPYVPYWD